MKNNFLLVPMLVVSLAGCKEIDITSSDVPRELMASFNAKYPDAKDVRWEVEKEKGKFYYEAEWKENGKEVEVHISPDGSMSKED